MDTCDAVNTISRPSVFELRLLRELAGVLIEGVTRIEMMGAEDAVLVWVQPGTTEFRYPISSQHAALLGAILRESQRRYSLVHK